MAVCRVYLLTYRRSHLLPRALNSLLHQTFTDWVCELHNDDPTDPFPQQLVEQIGDRRITVINHTENLGATRAFNQIFHPTTEPFISLLEDDNWWEPTFLETMLVNLLHHPEVQVAWANMRVWQEETDGTWSNTERTIWNRRETDPPELIHWGHPQQRFGALHSNGAMLMRTPRSNPYQIPEETPFEGMEAARERAFPFPLLFVPQVQANFALTRTTARSTQAISWVQIQTLLAGSALKYESPDDPHLQSWWELARSKPAKSTATLFFAALACPGCLPILRYAAIADWIFFFLFCVKHPLLLWHALRSIPTYPALWHFLDQHTADRIREAKIQSTSIREVFHTPPPSTALTLAPQSSTIREFSQAALSPP